MLNESDYVSEYMLRASKVGCRLQRKEITKHLKQAIKDIVGTTSCHLVLLRRYAIWYLRPYLRGLFRVLAFRQPLNSSSSASLSVERQEPL